MGDMPAYFIAQYVVNDSDLYGEYVVLAMLAPRCPSPRPSSPEVNSSPLEVRKLGVERLDLGERLLGKEPEALRGDIRGHAPVLEHAHDLRRAGHLLDLGQLRDALIRGSAHDGVVDPVEGLPQVCWRRNGQMARFNHPR